MELDETVESREYAFNRKATLEGMGMFVVITIELGLYSIWFCSERLVYVSPKKETL